MIVYFADRHMNILGVASDLLPGVFHIRDDMKTSEIESGLSTFEVTIDYKKENHITLKKYAAAGNFLLVREKDNTYIPYTIIDREDDIADRHVYVYAEDAGLDLLNEIVPAYEAVQATTAADYVLAFTADSGFEIGINEIAKNDDGTDKKRTLNWDSESTATERIRSVATEFDNAEIGYSFTIDKFRITHKYINLYKKHGKDVSLELRFGREVDSIVEKESVANLVTALRCVGGTPEATDANPDPLPITLVGYRYDDGDIYTDGVFLKSREANKKWSRYLTESGTGEGYIVGSFDYDTTSQQELCNRAITELKKLREPEITYEVALNTLPENLKLGDTCRIVDDNGELYVSARLIELKVSECNRTREATFGDFKKLTSGINDKVEKLAEEFAKIQAAKTLYTWMVFADDASGTNMSTSSVGKSYIGIATNKISQTPDLTNPLLYTFTRISAVDGRGFTVRGSWAPNTSYSITGTNIDVVEHEGSTYACNNSHVSGQTFDPSKWVLIAEKGDDGSDGFNQATIYVYLRSATTVSTKPGSAEYTFSTGNLSFSSTSAWSRYIPSGTDPCYVSSVSVVSKGATYEIAQSDWSMPTKLVEDGKPGDDGYNGATVYLYKRSSTTPTAPTSALTYTFSNHTLTPSSSLSGWSQTVPTSGTDKLWVILATASSSESTDEITSSEWSSPVPLEGVDGDDGYNSATIYLYKRQSGSAPSAPSGGQTYMFSTGALSAVPIGWSRDIPTGNDPCYVTTTAVASKTSTATVQTWSTPCKVFEDGEDGYSPTATVTKSGDTTTITITDKNGTTTQTILDGEDGHSPTITTTKSGTTTTILADGVSIGTVIDGDDGHSPSVTATKTDGVTTVKVDGTTIATINDGSSVIIQSATKVGDTTTVILKDGSGTQTLTIKDGEDGDNGQPGSNGDDAYVHIAWATSADGSEGFSTSVSEGKTYMGSYSDHTLADSQTPSDYNWSLIKGEDGYSPTATVTKSGSTATITITDKNGTTTQTVSDGTSATSYSLIVSHAAVVKAAGSNSYTPSSIDLLSKSQTGSGAFGNYAGRFKIETYNGTSWTARYTSSTNESSHSYIIPTNIDGIKAIRCSLYLAGGTTTLLDQQVVPIVSDGENGTSVSITAREYVESSSGTTTPSSGWGTTIPSVAEGKYLWTRISYSDGSYSYSVAKQGVSGQNGQSITVTETKYAEGTSATTAPTSGWGTSIPSVAEGNYLWTRVTYSDSTVTYSVAKQGLSGDDGEDAYTIVLTNENYTFVGSETAAIASNTSTGVNVAECNVIAYKGATQVAAHIGTISGKPTGMTTSISSNDSTSAKFTVTVSTSMATKNGVLTIPVYIDPASSSGKLFNMKFTYSLAIKGVDGRAITGVTNYYLATSASSGVTRSTSGWTTSVQSMTSTNQYLWNYEKLTYSSGTTTTYTDPVIIGRYGKDGQGGSAGKGITGITEYYQKSSSNSQAPTTWVTTPPTTTTSEPYLWNYEVITYTTGDPFTSEKRVIGTHGATGATGATGETGAQGLSLRGVLIRNRWTDAQWNTTYGIGYTGNFSNYDILLSSNGPNGKLPISTWNVGDLYQLTGTSTDTGKAYIATLRYTEKRTSDTTSIPSEVIALSYAEKGTDGEDGNGIVSKTDYYLLSDTMVSTDLSTAKSHVSHDLSGGIVTMTDAMGDIPFENVVANILPIQSGSGDPSPTNIRPITGWTVATVTRTGKNLLEPKVFTSGNGLTKPVKVDFSKYPSYTFSCNISTNICRAMIFGYSSKSDALRNVNRIARTLGTTENVRTISRDSFVSEIAGDVNSIEYIVVYFYGNGTTAQDLNNGEMQVEIGSSATAFEPYNGASYSVTWSEAGTVYGGTLDVVKGNLTKTHEIVDLGSFATSSWNINGTGSVWVSIPGKKIASQDNYCSALKMVAPNVGVDVMPDGSFKAYSSSSAIAIKLSGITTNNASSMLSGIIFIYELAEPVTYQLTPVEINSLVGLNNVWADTGDISLTYFDEHEAAWQITPVDPNQYSRYQWWYYNTTYTDGRSIDSDPAIICVYNKDWYEETQKAISDADTASKIANQAAENASKNADAIGDLQEKIEGTTGQPGIVARIGNLENTTATAQSVEDLRTEANNAINNLIAEYNLNEVLNWFHFDPDQGLIIGKNATTQDGKVNYVLRLEGDNIAFYEPKDGLNNLNDNQRVGYFQNRHLMSENMAALSTLDIGNFKFIKQDNGNLSFVYAG